MSEVVAMSVGPKKAEEQLRSAMGKGADKAIHVVTDEDLEPLNVAKLFQSVLKEVGELFCPFFRYQIIDSLTSTAFIL